MLNDKLLSLVWNGDVPVLPKHVDSPTVLALAVGAVLVVGTWVVVLMIASESRSKQGVLVESPRD